jgi:hypothetical protein
VKFIFLQGRMIHGTRKSTMAALLVAVMLMASHLDL